MTGLRAITRLAVRESLRRPWRSLLVVLLIALPVAAVVTTTTWVRSAVDSPEETAEQQYGQADLIVFPKGANQAGNQRIARFIEEQPGWRFVEWRSAQGLVASRIAGGRRARVGLVGLPLADPLTRGIASLSSGKAPSKRSEVAVSADLAAELGFGIGDRVTFLRPRQTVTVTGVVDRRWLFRAVVGPGLAVGTGPTTSTQFLVDTAGQVPASTFFNQVGAVTRERAQDVEFGQRTRDNDRLYLYLFGGLGMAAFGLIVSSALAVGARRQLRVLGLVGANGASPRQAGALILMQGAVLGLVGAVVGIVGGIAATPLLRPLVERFTDQAEGAIELQPVDYVATGLLAVVIAIAAAWYPARIAARTSVLRALGGRRPLSKLGLRVPLVGVVVSTLGCLVLAALVTSELSGDVGTVIASAAAVLIVGGLVICSPYLVGLLEPLASKTSGTLRLAARTIARQRSRTGPTVAAIMAASALAIAAGTIALTAAREESQTFETSALSRDVVSVSGSASRIYGQGHGLRCDELTRIATPLVEGAIPGAQSACLTSTVHRVRTGGGQTLFATVVAPEDLALIGAEAFAAALRKGAVVRLGGNYGSPRNSFQPAKPGSARVSIVQGPTYLRGFDSTLAGTFLVSSQTAARLEAKRKARRSTLVARPPDGTLTDSHLRALDRLIASDPGAQFSTAERDVYLYMSYQGVFSQGSELRLITYAVILPTALLLALLTALVGLALTAAETRDEQATLVAIGAEPRHRRRQNAWQGFIVAGLGVLLAIPGGLVPAAIVLRAAESNVEPPWIVLGALVVGLPLLAAAGAALLTRRRMSPLIRRSV